MGNDLAPVLAFQGKKRHEGSRVSNALKKTYPSRMEDSEELKRQRQAEIERLNKVTPKSAALALTFYIGVAAVAIFLFALFTGIIGGGSDTDPTRECFNYEKPNGDWANSCDE